MNWSAEQPTPHLDALVLGFIGGLGAQVGLRVADWLCDRLLATPLDEDRDAKP